MHKLRAAPLPLRITVFATMTIFVFALANLIYQVARKPTEVLSFAAGAKKLPAETWQRYGSLFREYSTSDVSPELLAALAQVEAAGDPLAHTYWRWRLTWNPFGFYGPASSSVGMYQMTDAAFAEARQYCIRDHTVVEDCWFKGLYTRLLPSHAVELATIFLDRHLAAILGRQGTSRPTKEQKQDLAAALYLCGPSAADAFARRGFKLASGERCGDQDAAGYLARVDAMKRQFQRLAAADQ